MELGETEILKRRRTKIVATVGPASCSPEMIGALIDDGVDVFRLNFSHGDHDSHAEAYLHIRAQAAQRSVHIAVLGDLCGPKIRVGRLDGGQIELEPGGSVVVTTREIIGGPGLIPSQYEDLARDVEPGSRVLLADGQLELSVDATDGTEARCTVVRGGVLKERQGVNLPGVRVSAPALTDKDREDVAFGLALGIDYFALSFVRRPEDIDLLRALLPTDRLTRIIAKIERAEAVAAAEAIIDRSDGVMIARGDLGVEVAADLVPIVQRRLVVAARLRAKPCIVATQMLESMTEHVQPTRAEVSDVSTAVFSGTDAVMLSAETASGLYPREAVRIMDRIAHRTEGEMFAEDRFHADEDDKVAPGMPMYRAIARATAQLSRDLRIRAIVAFAVQGTTVGAMSAARPAAPLLAPAASDAVARHVALLWGTIPVTATEAECDEPLATARRIAVERDLATEGDHILIVAPLTDTSGDEVPSLSVVPV